MFIRPPTHEIPDSPNETLCTSRVHARTELAA